MIWDIGKRYIAIKKQYHKDFEKLKNGENVNKSRFIFDECFD